ncbi:hypothetical protein [Streptomyces sp. NPDC006477]|uniref:hypothetical protein n=1 Tax=Streptomyces sp. NPDC006477 TaxID=3364747 RepID=UPI0036781D62
MTRVGTAGSRPRRRRDQLSLTVVTGGAVITGRPAPEALWRQRLSEVLAGSAAWEGPPASSLPRSGGMCRVSIADVSAWTVGDFNCNYSDH